MLLCRAARLSAAARDQPFKSPGSLLLLRVSANRPGHVTLTARTGRAFLRLRVSCASASSGPEPPSPVHLERPPPDPVRCWDSRSGLLTTTDWAHADRVSTVAVNLTGRVQPEGGGLDVIKQPLLHATRRHSGRAEPPAAHALFTGSTMTVQTRASSTSAATKRSDAGEERADGDKGDVQTLKKDSTTSSTEKGPEDTEPEGGQLSKVQQLKKVFKEYGAVGVCFHIGISLMSLGMCYALISSGIDMAAVLCKVGFSEAVVQSKMAAGTSTFVLAYAIHKLFAPLRISVTLVSVPLIVRYLRKTGLFKPPTPAP